MIDFRYHIVSLVAVFLALTVGVILGAGPLQNSIGDTLTGQVSSLSQTNEELKAENTTLNTQLKGQDQAWEVAAPTLVADALANKAVAVVSFPGAESEDIDAVKKSVKDAGATIVAAAKIAPEWTASSQTAFRTTFAEQISAYLNEKVDAAEANTVLNSALVQMMTSKPEDEKTSTLRDLMSSSDTAMLTFDEEPSAPADLVIFVSNDMSAPQAQEDSQANNDAVAQRDYDMKTFTNLVKFVSSKVATVSAGYANSPEDLLTSIRSAGVDASTVDSINTAVGRINIALAGSSELANDKVDLGFESGATIALGQRAIVQSQPENADQNKDQPADQAADGANK